MAYQMWNNSTVGFDLVTRYLADTMDQAYPGVGGSFIGIGFLLALFAIVFFVLGRLNPLAGFTTASFLCWLASIFLVALQLVHPVAFGLTFGMWVFGAIAFYMQSRD